MCNMGKMAFDVECVKRCLTEHGKVFTVRSYCLDNANVQVEGVGTCRRIRGFEVRNKSDIADKKFVNLSGFDSVDTWWGKICGFVGNRRKWIYLVKKL